MRCKVAARGNRGEQEGGETAVGEHERRNRLGSRGEGETGGARGRARQTERQTSRALRTEGGRKQWKSGVESDRERKTGMEQTWRGKQCAHHSERETVDQVDQSERQVEARTGGRQQVEQSGGKEQGESELKEGKQGGQRFGEETRCDQREKVGHRGGGNQP
ncbi:octapeptide-repeat protein T2-like [Notothenia coriiceps]|uniref:Octapeptide-repeat protein T2-like n=1 Tax=Notothenia coriiceps TaxID=8208 RepID=A0A6I9MJK6_9TELE|nr:PREDICTED: octapeptide-repeat protein T2-like [Notothenia coriiceps]